MKEYGVTGIQPSKKSSDEEESIPFLPAYPLEFQSLCYSSTKPSPPMDKLIARSVTSSILYNQTTNEGLQQAQSSTTKLISWFEIALSKFRMNNFGVLSHLQSLVGNGCYPIGAILNHSCSPNCVLVYGRNGIQSIGCIREVGIGEELTHSYVELCSCREERRKHLEEGFDFLCNCVKCVNSGNDEIDDKLDLILSPLSSEEETLFENELMTADLAFEKDDVTLELLSLRKVLTILRKHYHPFNKKLYEYEARALSATIIVSRSGAMSENEEEEESLGSLISKNATTGNDGNLVAVAKIAALEHCRNVLNFLENVLFDVPFHPLIVLQRITLADIYGINGDFRNHNVECKKVVEGLRVVVGEEDELFINAKMQIERIECL